MTYCTKQRLAYRVLKFKSAIDFGTEQKDFSSISSYGVATALHDSRCVHPRYLLGTCSYYLILIKKL